MAKGNFGLLYLAYLAGQRSFTSATVERDTVQTAVLRECRFEHLVADNSEWRTADFIRCVFVGSSFRGARLASELRFVNCSFERVDFSDSSIAGATFEQCSFDQADFANVQFYGVELISCLLHRPTFSRARLERVGSHYTSIIGAELSGTLFLASHLEPFCAPTARQEYVDRPTVDWPSVARSFQAHGLDEFLVWTGMPELVATYSVECARALDPDMLYRLMQSTFISHGAPDAEFAAGLARKLEANGVRTFLFSKDAVPGTRLHRLMYDGVNKYDRVILICSAASLVRYGVRAEIEETFARESRDGGASYLIPVTRDDYVYDTTDPLLLRIRDRVVADFRGVGIEGPEFVTPFQRLLRSLMRTDAGA